MRIVQLVSHNSHLYALDQNGIVYELQLNGYYKGRPIMQKVNVKLEEA